MERSTEESAARFVNPPNDPPDGGRPEPDGVTAPGGQGAAAEPDPSLWKYREIVAISADAIISVDESFRITDFNRGATQIFGYTPDEVLGQPLDILIPERFREIHRVQMRRFGQGPVAAKRMGEREQISGLRKTGEEFPADASISKVVVGGRLVYTVVLRDMTVQKRAEATQRFLAYASHMLAASLDVETTYRTITTLSTESLADCCVLLDTSNPNVIRRAAVAVRDPALEPVVAPFRGGTLGTGVTHPVYRAIDTGEPVQLDLSDYANAPPDDKDTELLRAIQVRHGLIVPMRARGRTIGALAYFRTNEANPFTPEDRAHAEELAAACALAADNAMLYRAATEAVRARDDVLAVVSHDLGNPLSAIRIGVSLLLRSAQRGNPENAWEHLAGIQQSVAQMERLIRDLLDIKRIEAGQLALEIRPTPPATLISSVLEMLGPLAEGKGIEIRARVAESLPPVRADRQRVIQALSNLLGNAVKFTPPGGHVDLSAQAIADEVVFAVRDDGPGIDPAHLSHIFDRFWQARRESERSGLGLGLAIVKGIVLAHGGRVWADSQIGAGTTVCFTLPYASPRLALPA